MQFTQPIEQRINEMIAGIRGDVGVKIFGDDFRQLIEVPNRSPRSSARIPGAVDVIPTSWPRRRC